MDVVIQSKDGASQQESLCNIHEDTTSDVTNDYRLVGSKCNAADNQQHCTK